jgi:DNA-binding GntR family transcriptional regulator
MQYTEILKTKKSSICEQIISGIVAGEYVPGEKLREGKLAEKFETSRAPVREALLELVNVGLARQVPRRGFYVVSLTKKEIINSFIVGGVLEGFALAQSIHCFFDMDFLFLEGLLKQMRDEVEKTASFTTLSSLDAQFHQFLASKYDNDLLQNVAVRTNRIVMNFLYFKQWSEMQSLEHFDSRHRKIIDVMRTKNQHAIEQTLRDHYAETGYQLGEYVDTHLTKKG